MTDEIRAQIVSPQVNDDRSVTFRLRAPEASEVTVQGLHNHPPIQMEKGDSGIWVGQSRSLDPELYSYSFMVDGTMMIDPSNRMVKKWLTCGSMVEVPGESPRLHERIDVPHGTVHQQFYHSETTGDDRPVYVYTPPGYHPNAPGGYPTLILLHGYGDDASAWIEVGRANFIADNLIADDRIIAPIIVMPYGHPIPIELRRDFDDYANENIEKMEQDILDDLLPFLSENYAIADDRERVAIVGLSMGGGQSIVIGLRNTDQFALIGGFSSASPNGDHDEISAVLGRSEDTDANRTPHKWLWIGCGEDDFLLQRNQSFVAWLAENEIDHTYVESEGGHDWIVWRKYLATFLEGAFPNRRE